MYASKIIKPVLSKAILDEDDDTLALVALCTGKPVARGTAPLIGRYVRIGDNICSDKQPQIQHLAITYEWSEDGRLTAIVIGSPLHGQMLLWRTGIGWHNCFGYGDHGDNACGGSAHVSAVPYPTIKDALAGRTYVGKAPMLVRAALMEGPLIRGALEAAAAAE